jgi:hypothetical protein
MNEEVKKFDDTDNPYSPIKVKPIDRGFYKTRIFDPENPRVEGNQTHETFNVFDDRSEEDIKILAEKGHRCGRRFKSAELLGSWMERLDGGPNPSAAKRERALKRQSDMGVRNPLGHHQTQPMHPDQRHAGVDAGTQLIDLQSQEIERLKAELAKKNQVEDNKTEPTNQLPTEAVENAGDSGQGEAEAANFV